MKYSFLLPYCKRNSFRSSLISFVYHYSQNPYYPRNDFEVVVIEDITNKESATHHNELMAIIDEFKDKINIVYCLDEFRSHNSAKKYNVGFKNSTGQFMVLSNPETFHEVDILSGFDEEFSINPNSYIICSCRAMTFAKPSIDTFEEYRNSQFFRWYQHSRMNNRCLHFCSALSRENFIRVGGFDERYCSGIAYEDDSFRHRVQANGIPFVLRDDLIVIHIEHERGYLEQNQLLYAFNGNLWSQHLQTNDFFMKFI
jgi:hypothetical protein